VRYDEREVVQRWWALPCDTWLPLSQGGYCLLVFNGRPGGPAGPDVRDAVLCFSQERSVQTTLSPQVGAVEFHVHTSDWMAHRHQYDERYNTVLLHVVLFCDTQQPVRRQDGQQVPVCSLLDCCVSSETSLPLSSGSSDYWPCQYLLRTLEVQEHVTLLTRAGLLRFEEKAHRLVEHLHTTLPIHPFDLYDTCLIPKLIEGMGYGRERDVFRSLGQLFVLQHGDPSVFDVWLQHAAPLDAGRLRAFGVLYLRWRTPGIWYTLHSTLCLEPRPLEVVRALLCSTGLSPTRADILICNIVLPFAYAVSLLEQRACLAQLVTALYQRYPRLPSNHITRAMTDLLRLPQEPRGACQQQGLHYIYQQTCREKRCDLCLLGRKSI
jgi:hypothetical protein